jgi:hypothetical protein
MSAALVPCAACARHVRADTDACPFCAAAREPTTAPARVFASRVSRAVAFAFGATLGVDCSAPPVPAYGTPSPPADAAPFDTGDGAAPSDAAVDAGADLGVRYGAPPPPDGG